VGGSATYNVDLIDATNGANVANVVFEKRKLDNTKGWQTVGPFKLGRSSLTLDHLYFTRISTTISTPVDLIDGGNLGYDNVRLYAKLASASGGGGGGNQGRGHRGRARGASCRNPDVLGTAGDDSLKGSAGKDVIAGLGGNDRIAGKGGNDVLCGGKGNDTVRGNAGRDRLGGGKGSDTCIGGSGRDRAANSCNRRRGIP
jgi:Ca2+-binding RTX toxin-like protein